MGDYLRCLATRIFGPRVPNDCGLMVLYLVPLRSVIFYGRISKFIYLLVDPFSGVTYFKFWYKELIDSQLSELRGYSSLERGVIALFA